MSETDPAKGMEFARWIEPTIRGFLRSGYDAEELADVFEWYSDPANIKKVAEGNENEI